MARQAPLQARILQWVSNPFSRGSSHPRSNPGFLHCRQILFPLPWALQELTFTHHIGFPKELTQRPSVQFSSVTQPCLILWDPENCSTPDLTVHHQLLELAQTHVHRVGYAMQPSYPLSSPSPPAFNLFQHQGLFQWISSSHQVAKVLELQFQHQDWIFRTDFL